MDHLELGRIGEDLAASFLEEKGLTILERGYRFDRAEVDLVCFQPSPDGGGGELVFVEVKTRRGTGFGRPEEAVTEQKKRNLIRAARAYLHERRMEGAMVRFDVVAVHMNDGRAEFEHFDDAFWAFGL